MTTFLQDLRYAIRMLAKSPGFTLVAVLTLALGIGANTTIFTWVNAFLLNGFPGVPNQDRLVVVGSTYRGSNMSVSYPDFEDLNQKAKLLDGIVAMDMAAMSLNINGQPERVYGNLVNSGYFDALQVKMLLGRGFTPEEGKTQNSHPVIVLSYGLWQRRFAADPAIVGKQVSINNSLFTVVGVAPEEFRGAFVGLGFDAYVPIQMVDRFVPGRRLDQRGNHWLDCLARLRPGVSIEEAQAELNVISKQLEAAYPDSNKEVLATLYPMWKAPYGATSVMGVILLVLSCVVAVVLLIACANIANLLLARATARRREMAIRLSLGAGRGRLVRQLLTESMMLALAGCAAGILVAIWSWDLLLAFMPAMDLPIALGGSGSGIDLKMLGYTMVVSILTGLIFGLAPALETSRGDVVGALKDEAGSLAGGGKKSRLRNSLVVAQVSLSLVLLICAGLLVRSLQNAQSVQTGFKPQGVWLGSVDLFPNGYNRETGSEFYKQLRDSIAALPGVQSVALARRVPLGFGGSSSSTIEVEGYVPAKDENSPFLGLNNVTPDYFRTMEIPLLNGRDFNELDTPQNPPVAIINQAAAARYWADKDPLGRRFRFGSQGAWIQVVGVVRDTKQRQLNEPPRPFAYFPLSQNYRPDVTIHVRSSAEFASLSAAVRGQVRSLNADLPLFNVRTLENHISAASFSQRLGGSLLAVFGFLAMLLAGIGVYGVMSYGVTQRTREIGIRMALGAQRADILRMLLGAGARLAGIGLAVGLALSFAATLGLKGLLLGVSPQDPFTFISVVLLLAGAAFLATYVPARRATRVDPMIALRYE